MTNRDFLKDTEGSISPLKGIGGFPRICHFKAIQKKKNRANLGDIVYFLRRCSGVASCTWRRLQSGLHSSLASNRAVKIRAWEGGRGCPEGVGGCALGLTSRQGYPPLQPQAGRKGRGSYPITYTGTPVLTCLPREGV